MFVDVQKFVWFDFYFRQREKLAKKLNCVEEVALSFLGGTVTLSINLKINRDLQKWRLQVMKI